VFPADYERGEKVLTHLREGKDVPLVATNSVKFGYPLKDVPGAIEKGTLPYKARADKRRMKNTLRTDAVNASKPDQSEKKLNKNGLSYPETKGGE